MSAKKRPAPGQCAQWACAAEVLAPKAGNVHPRARFRDACCADFLASALAIAPALDQAAEIGVGPAVLAAVEATAAVAPSNTNLGMILLLAPLCAVPPQESLRSGIPAVLAALTRRDASAVYAAIRLANPGGLGKVATADVRKPPRVTLLAAMTLAADRDLIAREYATGFGHALRTLAPRFKQLYRGGMALDDAIVLLHLEQMAREEDSLIVRKCGSAAGARVRQRAQAVLAAGYPGSSAAARQFVALDRYLRRDGHRRNPGSSADLIAAALFCCFREGWITGPWRWQGDLPQL